ncbi:hypothetical protein KPH14_009856 [Odynerus spinipes]|uniref:Uncharacterized protein n=1 Tax=Odynerus spinipes TaxID=1348599 RepID=A0AAD9RX93_9HYME|nr:hypothetical protein KPH14_009856 [Odynerus spinipes]
MLLGDLHLRSVPTARGTWFVLLGTGTGGDAGATRTMGNPVGHIHIRGCANTTNSRGWKRDGVETWIFRAGHHGNDAVKIAMERHQNSKEKKKVERTVYLKRSEVIKDPVMFDNISKEAMKTELKTRKKWSRRYECLSGEYFEKVLTEECRKAGLPADTFKRKPPEDPTKCSPIPLKPSPAIPRTASAIIGWRSSRMEYNLEFTGPMYISPKWTVRSSAEIENFPAHQRFIFLG